jgi:MFS family permease
MKVVERGALAGLALCMLLPSLGISIANVALPTLSTALGVGIERTQWVVLAYLLATTTLVVGAGRLADRLGRRRLLLAGIAVFTGGSGLCGCAQTLGQLVAARALQGAGAVVLMALPLALVSEAVPKGSAGRAMGLLGTMSAVGTALGPTLGGLLISAWGWRAVFLAGLPLGLLVLGLAWRTVPAGAASQGAAPQRGPAPWREAGSGLVLNAQVAVVMMTTLIVGPFYLARGLELDVARVGLAMSVGPVVSALGGVPAGRLVDRFGALLCKQAGLAGMLAGLVLLAALPGHVLAYVLPLAVLTASYALVQAANNTAVMSGVAAERRGVAAGLLTLARNLGFIAGAPLMAAVFAAMNGAAAGMRASYALAAALLLPAMLWQLPWRRLRG